jgi:hypothetical protein
MNSRRGSTTSPISLANRDSPASSTFAHLDAQHGAGVGVERRLPQLLRVHLAQPLVALQRQPLVAEVEDASSSAMGPRTMVSVSRRLSLAARP